MIHTKTLPKSNPTDLLKKAIHIASCYGFDSMDKIIVQEKKRFDDLEEIEKKANLDAKKPTQPTTKQKCIKQTTKSCNTDVAGDEILCALKTAAHNKLLPNDRPLLIQQSSVVNDPKEKKLNFGKVS